MSENDFELVTENAIFPIPHPQFESQILEKKECFECLVGKNSRSSVELLPCG
jgi:hypothetical protein